MAKLLGEVNYEYLIEFFGAVEGHEDFFTSDDGDEVLVIPAKPKERVPFEAGSKPSGSERVKAAGAVSPRRRIGVFKRLFAGIATFGRWIRRIVNCKMTKSLQQVNLEFKKEYVFERKPAGPPKLTDVLMKTSVEFRNTGKAELEIGGVVWRVLTVRRDALLLISKDILGRRKFHGGELFRGWNGSEIREYLNGPFLSSFPAEAKSLIAEAANHTARTCDDNTLVASNDMIFLLSFDEAKDGKYFADEKDRTAICAGVAWWWWLRCPGAGFDITSGADNMVMAVDKNGAFNRAYIDLAMGGVRPALWMRLSDGDGPAFNDKEESRI
jgi:hypothetical protein